MRHYIVVLVDYFGDMVDSLITEDRKLAAQTALTWDALRARYFSGMVHVTIMPD